MAKHFKTLHKVVKHYLRGRENDHDYEQTEAEAAYTLAEKGHWMDYHAIRHGQFNQIIGYTWKDPKDWFILYPDRRLAGPYWSKGACMKIVGAPHSTRLSDGVYLTDEGPFIFRRAMSCHAGLPLSKEQRDVLRGGH
jgi:hypothetical protein